MKNVCCAKQPRIVTAFVIALLALLFAVVSSPAEAQIPTNIADFDNASGAVTVPRPPGVITQGRDGNLYTATDSGGFNFNGGVVSLTPAGVLTTVYNFQTTDGTFCLSGVTQGNDNNLYGTCTFGGANNFGVVYKLTLGGTFTTLHAFSNTGGDGYEPAGPPVQASDGNFYGVTTFGGAGGFGTVYKITPSGTVTTLHSFTNADGNQPLNSLFQGSDGNLYGTTEFGGANTVGEVFKMTLAGNVTVLHSFNVSDGAYPECNTIQGKDGNYYGTTNGGGANGEGTIFKVSPAGAFTSLHSFTSGATGDGINPVVGLIQATNGAFYGVVFGGGTDPGTGNGTLYKMAAAGVFTLLYYFDGTTSANPVSLIQDTNGLIYGDTATGGFQGLGAAYTLNIGAAPFASLLTTSGKVGKAIGILGQGFSHASVVKFGGVQAASFTLTGTTFISATVPVGALTGSVTVKIGATTLTSNKNFRVTPTFPNFNPTSGTVGTAVVLTGTGLTQTTKVTFGGVAATTFTVDSDSQVTANVPTGAVTGKIVITTMGGSVPSATNFTVN